MLCLMTVRRSNLYSTELEFTSFGIEKLPGTACSLHELNVETSTAGSTAVYNCVREETVKKSVWHVCCHEILYEGRLQGRSRKNAVRKGASPTA